MRFILILSLLILVCSTYAQTSQKTAHAEQTRFGLEEPIDRPASIPEDVLKILRQDSDVTTCELEAGSRDRIPATWYEASRIHLDGTNRADLIVKAKNACLMGPNLGPFWVFRKTAGGHDLVLSTVAVGVQILKNKTNGLRDIRIGAIVNLQPSYVTYRFDGHAYQPD